ncbi:MAG TPA: hypothetical protein VJP02_04570 [Candidatus Sulfotelmatobacter sp.]|nr:hypothetical protein [Candidatus Sulfotelmatobacter sp.]
MSTDNRTATARLKGINGTSGTFNIQMNVEPEGQSAKDGFMVPDGEYEMEYTYEGKRVSKKVSFGVGKSTRG